MFTFLRQIRKSLIESGNAKKYLIYAIGEITLVVIGILIALQINNWNEWRKDRIVETKALQDLLQEFKSNKIVFDDYIKDKQESSNEWLKFLNLITDPKMADSAKELKRPPYGRNTYTPSMGMINSIMESDKIDKLENDSLRYWLSNWNDIILRIHKSEEIQQEFLVNVIMPYEASIIPMVGKEQIIYRDSLEFGQYYINAYYDMNYVNLLTRNRHFIGGITYGSRRVDSAFNTIINLLEKEIDLPIQVL